MGAKINYKAFITEFDKKLQGYFESYGEDICCKKGCSSCCEKGDYPLSELELEYLMKGYAELDSEKKILIQNNIKNMVKGGVCPFLVNKECSVYKYRPIICRVHGLAYYYKDSRVKLPHCVNDGKNFSKKFKNGYFEGNPIAANLDTPNILAGVYKNIKNLYDWINES